MNYQWIRLKCHPNLFKTKFIEGKIHMSTNDANNLEDL